MDLSIVIPAYNEREGIAAFLNYLFNNLSGEHEVEFLIADGGSTDGTQKAVRAFKNVHLLNTEKGRARQMNSAASEATGTVLYFLHADSYPPPNFDQSIIEAVSTGNPAGCFKMKFDSSHPWLRLMAQFTKVNHISCRGGDQSLFVLRQLFEEIGGYDESYIVYEDNDFIEKLYDRKTFYIIGQWLTTSARKYREIGFWRLQWLYVIIYYKRWNGATPQELLDYYNRVVKTL